MKRTRFEPGRAADAAGAAVLLLAVTIWLLLDPAGPRVSQYVSASGQSAAALLAGVATLRAATRASDPRGRRSWLLLAAGSFGWAVANVLYLGADLSGNGEPFFPSIADFGFLALLPLTAAALLAHPVAPRRIAAVTRLGLDALISGGALLFVTRAVVTASRHASVTTDPFRNAAGVAYAVGDFTIVALAFLLASRARGRNRVVLLVLAGAFVAHGVGDGLFTMLVLGAGYSTGSLVDVLWMAGFVGIALAARSDRGIGGVCQRPSEREETRLRVVAPSGLAVAALVVAATDVLRDGEIDPFLAAIGFSIAVLVLVRHVGDRLRNLQLVRSLRGMVDDLATREAQLAEAQRIAQIGSWEWDATSDSVAGTDELVAIFDLPFTGDRLDRGTFLAQIAASDRARVLEAASAALADGSTWAVDYRLERRPDRIIHGRGTGVFDEGRLVGMVGTAQDVTQVRALRQELEHRLAELERSNADLAHFAAVASHDLAAPVQILLGHLRLLRDRARAGITGDDVDLVEGAITGAQRLEDLIQHILAYSLATTGDDDLRAEIDATKAAKDAARAVGASQRAASLVIDDLPRVVAHPGQIRQLFQNLLANAVKFAAPDRPPHIRVWAEADGSRWQFAVADNGIGVPERDRTRIFEMFERGEIRDVQGTGIGLAICARIVARHGGRIWVEPAPAGGSVFRFTWPRLPAPAEDSASGSSVPAMGRS